MMDHFELFSPFGSTLDSLYLRLVLLQPTALPAQETPPRNPACAPLPPLGKLAPHLIVAVRIHEGAVCACLRGWNGPCRERGEGGTNQTSRLERVKLIHALQTQTRRFTLTVPVVAGVDDAVLGVVAELDAVVEEVALELRLCVCVCVGVG